MQSSRSKFSYGLPRLVVVVILVLASVRSFTVVWGRARQRFDKEPTRRLSSPQPRFATEGNLLESIDYLDQDYFALRHGQSLANVAGIIMSDPVLACCEYGLSDAGKQQAERAADDVRRAFQSKDYGCLVMLTSDLLRAKETATVVCDKNSDLPILQGQVISETRLRERWFGEWDASSDSNYNNVWQDDAKDASHTIKGVEAVYDVMERTTKCILEWDKRLSSSYDKRCMIVLVAHGDVLQILQTAFEKKDGRNHRDLQHLQTAQLRQLKLATTL